MKIFLPLVLSLILVAGSTLVFADNIPQLVTADNDFGFKLFNQLTNEKTLKNVMISPVSIATALAMTYNGAGSETQTAMAKTLSIEWMNLLELNQSNLAFKNYITKTDPKITLAIANSLWADKGIQFKKDFLTQNKKFYKAKVTTLDFANPKSAAEINKWVNKETKGKIPTIVDEIGGDVIAFLINAIYFKGNWTNKFDIELTKKLPFFLLDGTESSAMIMSQDGRYDYFKTEDFQAVRLPYANGKINMNLFLPNKPDGLVAFLRQVNVKNWSAWTTEFSNKSGNISLPRFKIEYEKSLKDALSSIGMNIAFDENRADFTKMCTSSLKGNVYIGDVKHKTFIEVNEQGTEAAAVTSVVMEIKSVVTDRFSMVFDHPFFYAICDNETGSILFMGIVCDPNKN